MLATARLAEEEGFRSLPYRDTVGKLTIGYGCNLDAGWSQALGEAVLAHQLNDVYESLSKFWWWAALDDVRAAVLLDMGFNLGISGLLHFPKMLAAISRKDWALAAAECLDSDAARQLPRRYKALSDMLLTGVAS